MVLDELKPNVIVRGALFSEPVQVIAVMPLGTSIKLYGKGLKTGRVHEPVRTPDQLASHVEPQRLASVILFPDQISVQPGARIQFRAEGRDQHGRPMSLEKTNWTAGGAIESNGSFTAGDGEGSFQVQVAAGDIKGTANVSVAKQPQRGDPGGGNDDKHKDDKKGHKISQVQWTGQVPSAKWMTFYTKVLAKYAKEKGLTLKATFELRPENGLTVQQVDEIRAALRELALDDEVETK